MKTTYLGINYAGRTNANRDESTGIRYGIIPQNDLMAEAIDDVFTQGRDLGFENYIAEVKQNLRNALSDVFNERGGVDGESPLDLAVNEAFEAIEQDVNDRFFGESGPYYYEHEGYAIQTDDSGDAWCFKSPFFTYAQFCSPCAPGACHLRSPLEIGDDKTRFPDNRCYCFGHDWFDDSTAPYPVYSVETGEQVLAASL